MPRLNSTSSALSLIILIAFGLITCSEAAAQSRQVIRDKIEVQWSEDGQRFWFPSRGESDKIDYVLVDAKNGTRQLLFDPVTLAARVEKTAQQTVDLTTQVRRVDYDINADILTISLGERGSFSFNRCTDQVEWIAGSSGKDSEAANNSVKLSMPVMASDNSSETTPFSVTNELESEVEVLWVDAQRNEHSYAKLTHGKTFTSQSYIGHVWLFRDLTLGQDLGCFRLTGDGSGQQVLNKASIENVQKSPTRRRRRPEGPRGDVPANRSHGATSPSGDLRLFVKDHNLWAAEVESDSSNERALTRDGTEQNSFHRSVQSARLVHMAYDAKDADADQPDVVWPNDSRYAIAWQTTVVPERIVVLKRTLDDGQVTELGSYPYAKPGDPLPERTLRLFEMKSLQEIPIQGVDFSEPWELGEERFSNDGKQVWIRYQQRGHQKLQIVRIELATGQATVVIDETSPTFLHYSAGEKYRLTWQTDSTAIWSSERSGWNHLYHIDMITGKILNVITSGNWNVIRIDRIVKDQIWFYAVGIDPEQDPYFTHYCRVSLDGTEFCRLTDGNGMHSVTWSPNEEYLIDRYSRVDQPPIHELRMASDGSKVTEIERGEVIVHGNEVSGLNSIKKTPSRPFAAPGRDGEVMIWGVVHFPLDYDENKSYPVIESIYAGPHDYHVPKEFSKNSAFNDFRQAGYVVVQIDGMGTAWRSKAFHDVCYRNLRDAGFPDRIAWIKALAKQYPNLDLNRVGIFGGSAGGQNAMAALLWHNSFYKVAVADCGCHDNRMDKVWWNEQWMGKVSPGEHYVTNSNTENAHLLDGALMLVVGEVDRNVDPASTLQVAEKLTQAKKEFKLMVVPDSGHGACESPPNRKKRLEFFQEHL